MVHPPLNVLDGLSGIAFEPLAIERLGGEPKLDDQVAGEVQRLDLAALFLPEVQQGNFVIAHDDAGIRAADEVTAALVVYLWIRCHGNPHFV